MARHDAQAEVLSFDKNNLPPVEFTNGRVEAETVALSPVQKRIVFVIAHLGAGGAQRVAVNAANALANRGLDVHVIILNENKNIYQLDPRISLHARLAPQVQAGPGGEGRSSATASRLSRVQRIRQWKLGDVFFRYCVTPWAVCIGTAWLRRTIKSIEPDAVLSFLTQTNITTILATRGLKTRTVISERNDPRLQRHRRHVEAIRWLVYRHAEVVTANSRGALAALEPFVPKEKLAFLPNPLSIDATNHVAALAAPTVVTVGRLVGQKGLDVLLAAWARCVEQLPGWRLAIVGDGPLLDDLKALARELAVETSVDWHGHLADPLPLVRAAKFFVLTSRFEGTPNALLEAMACGLPAVVSDASPGPCELVGEDESAGLVVPVENAQATADAIARLAQDETLCHRLARVARERAREHEADRALEVWLQLLRCE